MDLSYVYLQSDHTFIRTHLETTRCVFLRGLLAQAFIRPRSYFFSPSNLGSYAPHLSSPRCCIFDLAVFVASQCPSSARYLQSSSARYLIALIKSHWASSSSWSTPTTPRLCPLLLGAIVFLYWIEWFHCTLPYHSLRRSSSTSRYHSSMSPSSLRCHLASSLGYMRCYPACQVLIFSAVEPSLKFSQARYLYSVASSPLLPVLQARFPFSLSSSLIGFTKHHHLGTLDAIQ
jgi:hypothetical protein